MTNIINYAGFFLANGGIGILIYLTIYLMAIALANNVTEQKIFRTLIGYPIGIVILIAGVLVLNIDQNMGKMINKDYILAVLIFVGLGMIIYLAINVQKEKDKDRRTKMILVPVSILVTCLIMGLVYIFNDF